MKLLGIILQTLTIASISGQKTSPPDFPDSSDLSLHEKYEARALREGNMMPEDGKDNTDIGPLRRGLRGGRRLYWETNVGNGGNARTGDAYGAFGTTGHARGGDGGNGNTAIQKGYQSYCGRRCRRYGRGRTNVGNGGNARTGNAYGPYGTTGNARGGDGGDGNVVVTRGPSRPYWDPPYYGPYYDYGGVTNVGNGGDARTGDAYGPFGTTGHAKGGDGGDGNVVVNQWDDPWWD